MAETRGQIPFVKYDTDGRIDQDLPCLKCGYNLRTLLDDGTCPECGASIPEMAEIGWLFQYDRTWLRRLKWATIFIGIALVSCALYMSAILEITASRTDHTVHPFVILGLYVAPITGLIGFWESTAPQRRGGLRQGRMRRVARWMVALGLAGLPLALLVEQLPQGLKALVISCSVACLGVGAWATITYAASVAAKIPAPRLAKQVHIVGWGLTLCLFSLGFAIAGSDPVWETVGVSTAAGLLLFSVWAIPLLVWCHRSLREAREISQRQAQGSGRW